MEESTVLDKYTSVEKYKNYLKGLIEGISKDYGENCASVAVMRILLQAFDNPGFVEGLQ